MVGVRNLALDRIGPGGEERKSRMQSSLRQSLCEIADPRHLDGSVEEVFELMLGTACRREPEAVAGSEEQVTAVVGFGGLLSGACVFRSGGRAACELAGRMTGMEFAAVDDTVKDAIGEICNMLAGSWKGKVPELASQCGLSVPAVITGHDYQLHVQAPEFRLEHLFSFDGMRFEVMIICDGLQ